MGMSSSIRTAIVKLHQFVTEQMLTPKGSRIRHAGGGPSTALPRVQHHQLLLPGLADERQGTAGKQREQFLVRNQFDAGLRWRRGCHARVLRVWSRREA